MDEKKLSTILEALADKIDNLELGVYIKNLDNEKLRGENEKLKEENDKLLKTVKILEKAIAQEVE